MIEINWNPPPKELRVFALLEILFFGIVSWLIYQQSEATAAALAIVTVSVSIGLIGLAVPRVLRPLYVAWMAAAFPIGWTVSHLLMAGVYYLVVTPIGLVMRLCGHDPMERKFDRSTTTYWKARRQDNSTRRYFRQF